MKAFLYARVSTGDQNESMQLREMVEYARRAGWDYETFTDAGWSGAKEQRPALDQMMSLIRKRKADVVLVYRFDRFARSTRQLVNALEEFRVLGVQFVSIHEAIDTNTPMGRFAFTVFAAIAEFERELIRERVRSGIAHARSKGKRLGRPASDVDAAQIAQLRKRKHSYRAIAREVGVSEATVRRLVKSNGSLRQKCVEK